MSKKMFSVTYDEVEDGTIGICIKCGELAYGVEPDARKYHCEACGSDTVYGAEEAVLMGFVGLES